MLENFHFYLEIKLHTWIQILDASLLMLGVTSALLS